MLPAGVPVEYGDDEALVIGWLPTALTQDGLPTPRAGVATPADTDSDDSWFSTGFVKVTRVGGASRFGVDYPRHSVQCFAGDYGSARDLANRVRGAYEGLLPGYRDPDAHGVVIDVQTASAPTWVAYDNPRAFRFVATYQLTVHAG